MTKDEYAEVQRKIGAFAAGHARRFGILQTERHEDTSIFAAMERKDPRLYSRLQHVPIHEVMGRWQEVYPDDFPNGWLTEATDGRAIKANPPTPRDPAKSQDEE